MSLHIATSDLSRQLSRLIGQTDRVLSFSDNLLIGPCPRSLEDFVRARVDYWRGVPASGRTWRARYMRLLDAVQSHSEIIIWSTGSLHHEVLCWMICSLANDLDDKCVRLMVCVRDGGATEDVFQCGECPLGPGKVRAMLADGGQLLSRTQRRVAARNWRRFTAPDPARFNRACRSSGPRLQRIGQYHVQFFPRKVNERLRLSCFDESLFAAIGSEWKRPAEIVMAASNEGRVLRRFLYCTGDAFIARRMYEWHNHTSHKPAIEIQIDSPQDLFHGVRYRMSRYGRSLLKQGLHEVSRGPVCFIGGGAAYDSKRGSVAVMEDGAWRLVDL
ncbi:DUF1835 domain-containing protein [Chondromyces crocatus]|uniref:DUF1835 domain-containing protein n=1 Tax=Chondromyces crocatus TaxID=52 RepID=A0A0K1EE99_CHOCO|nr:uncharacterized protein CMC5_033380 [Chondromyces crocatus]